MCFPLGVVVAFRAVCWTYNPKTLQTATSEVVLLPGQKKLGTHAVVVVRVVINASSSFPAGSIRRQGLSGCPLSAKHTPWLSGKHELRSFVIPRSYEPRSFESKLWKGCTKKLDGALRKNTFLPLSSSLTLTRIWQDLRLKIGRRSQSLYSQPFFGLKSCRIQGYKGLPLGAFRIPDVTSRDPVMPPLRPPLVPPGPKRAEKKNARQGLFEPEFENSNPSPKVRPQCQSSAALLPIRITRIHCTIFCARVGWPGHPFLLIGNAVRLSKSYTMCAKTFRGLGPLGRKSCDY